MNQSAKDICFIDLKARILSTELEPGSDLDEKSLSTHYGLSRTPLREVLQRLSGEGYVRLEANRGAKVASMDVGTMRTFFQTAPMIYSAITRLAAENRTPQQVERLIDVQRLFRDAIDRQDPSAAALENHQFHRVIGEMAQNAYLMASLDRLLIDHTRLSQTFYRPASKDEHARMQKAIEHHDEMISAISNGEALTVVDVVLQHWDLSRDRMEHFVRPDPLPVEPISTAGHRNAV